jgi:mannan endo-1,4-beta-mannosidase
VSTLRGIFLSGGPAWIFVKLTTILFAAIALSRLLPGPDRQVPHYRPRPLLAAAKYAGGTALIGLLVGACAVAVEHPAAPQATAAKPWVTHTVPPDAVGVFVPGDATSIAPTEAFAKATGVRPSIVLAYSALTAPFNTGFARQEIANGATPFIQLMPGNVSMAKVASGAEDAQLREDAAQVRSLTEPVMLSFAPEPNGNWYSWGWSHTPPTVWIAAWRHVVNVFRSDGAHNVTWVWTMNVPFKGSGPISDYWPGASYVSEVGIDGYYVHPTDTFSTLFGPIIADARKLSARPVLISETAAGPDSGPRRETQIRGLFAGVKTDHLVGFVWFDQTQNQGIYHQNWRLEDDPTALAAFRSAAKTNGMG